MMTRGRKEGKHHAISWNWTRKLICLFLFSSLGLRWHKSSVPQFILSLTRHYIRSHRFSHPWKCLGTLFSRGKRDEKSTQKRCQNTTNLRIRSDSYVYVIFYWHNLSFFSSTLLALFMKFMIWVSFHRRFYSRFVWSLSWRFIYTYAETTWRDQQKQHPKGNRITFSLDTRWCSIYASKILVSQVSSVLHALKLITKTF